MGRTVVADADAIESKTTPFTSANAPKAETGLVVGALASSPKGRDMVYDLIAAPQARPTARLIHVSLNAVARCIAFPLHAGRGKLSVLDR